MRFCCLAILASALASGCVRAHAKTGPDAPPLDMPAPPPRDVGPNETEAPQPGPLVAEPARDTPLRQRPTPREQPRAEPPKPEPPKPEPPPTELPKPVEEPARPPTILQTAPTTVEGEVERAIRATLAHATTDLNRIDYRALSADARTQYDTAKRFTQQADDAMRSKNLVFAKNLADKAAALAAQLAGR
jgi:outer membrane biosynthesis protein TonB